MPASVVDEIFRRHARAATTGMQGSSSGGIHKTRLEHARRVDYRTPSHAQAAAQRQMEKASYTLAQIVMCDERIKALASQDPSIPRHSMEVIDYGSPAHIAFGDEMNRLWEKRHGYVEQLRTLYGDDTGPDFDLEAAARAVQAQRAMESRKVEPPASLKRAGTRSGHGSGSGTPLPGRMATEIERAARQNNPGGYLETGNEDSVPFYSMGA